MLDWVTEIVDALVPIVAIVSTMGAPVVIAMLYFRHINRREQRLAEMLQAMIRSDQDVPVELLHGLMALRRDDIDYLPRGAVLTSIGVGVGLFGWVGADSLEVVGIGLLIVAIGVGYLVLAKVRRDNKPAVD